MATLFSFRLDRHTRQRLTRLARRRRVPASLVVREMIQESLRRQERTGTLYERISHLIGIVHGGDPNRSKDIGRKYAKALKARRKRR